MQQCMNTIVPIFTQIFNEEKCLEVAKKTQFISRSSSRIKGHEFLKMLIIPSEGINRDSLMGWCDRIAEFNPDANISASALCQRINQISAVKFMRAAFEELLNISRKKILKENEALRGFLGMFNNIYIQDSTLCELHECHSNRYVGTRRGNNCCKSQVKIDLIHNYSTGQIVDVDILSGKTPDQALAERAHRHLRFGDLIIRDLGYFAIKRIKSIQSTGAYHLSRYPTHLLVFLTPDDGKPIDLEAYVNKHHPNDAIVDLPEVYISAEKLKTRLVLYRMPAEEIEKRLRRLNKHAKETGRTPSKAKTSLLKFSIFVTNIPASLVSGKAIGTLYRLRWEIELIFKQWKSKMQVHYLKGTNRHRIDCLIWGRLCMVLLSAMLLTKFMRLATDLFLREASPEKLLGYLMRRNGLGNAIATRTLESFIKRVAEVMPRALMKNRRSRKTMLEMALSCDSYYGCVETCA